MTAPTGAARGGTASGDDRGTGRQGNGSYPSGGTHVEPAVLYTLQYVLSVPLTAAVQLRAQRGYLSWNFSGS